MQPLDGFGEALQRLGAMLVLIALNAFFVAAEFAIVSVRRSRISQLVQEGDLQAKTVQRLQQRLDRLLSTTQLGITLSSLALGWIGEGTMGVLIAQGVKLLPVPTQWQQGVTQSLAIPLAFLGVVYLHIVLGELTPKVLALSYPEQSARLLGDFSEAIARVFNPLVWLLNQSTQLLLKLAGIRYSTTALSGHITPRELQLILTASEATSLRSEDRQLLNNVFEFTRTSVGEVMTPRTALVLLPETVTWGQFLQNFAATGFNSYPVVGDSPDEVRGLLDITTLATPLSQGHLQWDTPLTPWLTPAELVPEYMLLTELLPLMRRLAQPFVIVVDEYGATAGGIAWRDLIAEIFGDRLSSIPNQQLIKQMDPQTYLIQAQISLEEVNQRLGTVLPASDRYNTLGGFLIDRLQRLPNPGDSLHYDNLELTLISSAGPRLNYIQLRWL